jgi:hypothetical protein
MPQLIGYALSNNCIATSLGTHAQELLVALQRTGQLAPQARVALSSQLCLLEEHRGRGLMPALVAQLLVQLALRYDYLYATVHHLNERSRRYHQREGYQQVAADAGRLTFLKSINDTPTFAPLPAYLRLRPGTPADAPALYTLSQQWTRATRGDNLAEGFLTTLYSVADYEALCAADEVAVLEDRSS